MYVELTQGKRYSFYAVSGLPDKKYTRLPIQLLVYSENLSYHRHEVKNKMHEKVIKIMANDDDDGTERLGEGRERFQRRK